MDSQRKGSFKMTKIHDIRSQTKRSNGTRSESAIRNIARHHSATATGDFFAFWKTWNGVKGWGTGGYHEIILRDGSVQLCYDPIEITNGVANHNTNTYHICVVGNGSFTAAQEEAWNERCQIALKRFKLPVSAVKGHNEFSGTNTACPGINMSTVRKALSTGQPIQATNPVKDRNYFLIGDVDPRFKAIQADLTKIGYKLGVDGIFGTDSEKVVKAFQRANNLNDDGVWGTESKAKLDAILENMNKPTNKPVTKPKEDEDMLEQAIVIGSLNDYAAAEMLAVRKGIPIFPRGAIKGEVAKELIIVGGDVAGLIANKIINLSGKTRFETAKKVSEYL